MRRVLLLGLLLGLVGCDHATKHAALALRDRDPVSLVPGIFDLRYTENHDAAFSLFRSVDAPWKSAALLGLTAAATFAVLVAFGRRRGAPAGEGVAWALILSGAIGNLADRAALGYVVDFMHLAHWPVFNVADVAIVLGAGALGLAALRSSRVPGR